MPPAVALDNLRKVYDASPPVTALDGVSLEVPAGIVYGLLGPNGAGKTTAIGVCTTKVRATSGSARVAGIDVRAEPVEVRRRIGVAAQAITLDRSCTVVENLYYHCRYSGIGAADARKRSLELLERFHIADRRDAMPAALSGGLAQRVQLARAISHRPAVLFLDEPTAGLDPQSRLALWDLVGSLTADGITVVLTTHYMEEADRLCQRLAIIDHGRVLAEGSPADLKQQSGGTTVIDASLGGDHAAAKAALAGLPFVRDIQELPQGLRVMVGPDPGGVPAVVTRLAGHHLTDLKVVEPSLETMFIQLTGRDLRE